MRASWVGGAIPADPERNAAVTHPPIRVIRPALVGAQAVHRLLAARRPLQRRITLRR